MRALSFAAILFASACSTQATSSFKSLPATDLSASRSPINVEWIIRQESEKAAQLTLKVEKSSKTETDLDIRLEVPPGVDAPTRRQWSISAAESGVLLVEIELGWKAAPATDLKAIIDTQGKSLGYHAEVPYRFGRPAPQAPELPRAEPVQVGGTNLGAPVDLKP
jgi:ABC-type glycerol-3-phosphate transport system substrate-binding protein